MLDIESPRSMIGGIIRHAQSGTHRHRGADGQARFVAPNVQD